jgi:hypothetical protein
VSEGQKGSPRHRILDPLTRCPLDTFHANNAGTFELHISEKILHGDCANLLDLLASYTSVKGTAKKESTVDLDLPKNINSKCQAKILR